MNLEFFKAIDKYCKLGTDTVYGIIEGTKLIDNTSLLEVKFKDNKEATYFQFIESEDFFEEISRVELNQKLKK